MLLLALWVQQSVAEGTAQGPHSLMQAVTIVIDVNLANILLTPSSSVVS